MPTSGTAGSEADVGIAGELADAFDLRIDRVDRAGEAVLLQVGHRPPGGLGRIGRGADDGDAARPDEAGDGVHGITPSRTVLARKAITDSRCSVLV